MTDSMQQLALDTLGAYFGYTSFRPGQDRMVDAILAGRDALGVMPTGAGARTVTKTRLLPVPGHIHDPVPTGRLLLVMSLVLACGI